MAAVSIAESEFIRAESLRVKAEANERVAKAESARASQFSNTLLQVLAKPLTESASPQLDAEYLDSMAQRIETSFSDSAEQQIMALTGIVDELLKARQVERAEKIISQFHVASEFSDDTIRLRVVNALLDKSWVRKRTNPDYGIFWVKMAGQKVSKCYVTIT